MAGNTEIREKNVFIEDESELKLISPFALFVVGCTGSGKSVTVLSWLKNAKKVFRSNFNKIYYFYGSTHQEIFCDKSLKHVHFSKDLQLLEKLSQKEHPNPGILIILDDLMNQTSGSDLISQLYTKGSHHHRISIINIVQNIFHKTPIFCTLKENSQYYYIKQFINERKIKLLAGTIGLDPNELYAAYTESISKDRYAGILIDNNIKSNIRKLTRMRDKLDTNPGLYITDAKFEMFVRKNVLKQINEDTYHVDLRMLQDRDATVSIRKPNSEMSNHGGRKRKR